MTAPRTRLASLALPLLALPLLATLASAQVPPGHAVVATHSNSSWPGTPGLFIFPLDGGPSTQGTPITNLPPELNTVSTTGQEGAWAVSIRSSDGAILVTTATDTGALVSQGDVKLFILHLNGTTVSSFQEVLLGTASAHAAINHAQMPDGRIFCNGGQGSNAPVSGGPMAGFFSAIVDVSGTTPTITTLPNVTFPAGFINSGGVAIDPTGQYAYLLQSATYYGNPSGGWALVRQELTAPYADCIIATEPSESGHGIRCDDDGTLYVASASSSAMLTHSLSPNGCNTLSLNPATADNGPFGPFGLDLERATGMLVSTAVTFAPAPGNLGLIDPATGVRSVIGVAPPGGWSLLGNQSVAVNNAMDSYGPRSDGTNHYWFENFPNAAGQPYVSNTNFALSMTSAPGSALASAIALSFARGSFPVLGAEILVDPATTVTQFVASGQSVSYPLPLPAAVGLAGTNLTAQSLHLEPGNVLAASRGLEFTIALFPAPKIDSITPFPAQPNTTITLAGANFYNGMELRIGGNLTPIATQTAESITFVMPSGVQCDTALSLTNFGGAAAIGTINPSPTIGFMSLSGPTSGGAIFAITGDNLLGATVTINGNPLVSIFTSTMNTIAGTTPPGAAGTVQVVVTGPTGCMATGSYTYQ